MGWLKNGLLRPENLFNSKTKFIPLFSISTIFFVPAKTNSSGYACVKTALKNERASRNGGPFPAISV